MDIPITLDSLIRAVEHSSPDDVLGQLANASAAANELGELGDSLLGVFVDRSRRDGRSWAEIGRSLGVTKQAVQQRFVSSGALPVTFERFTQRARGVLVHAQQRARDLQHNYVGTEHLLLGLFDEPEGIAAKVLGELGTSADGVRDAVLGIIPRGHTEVIDEPPYTPRAARSLELALSCALELGHNYIGTEHELLGLLRESDGVAAIVLRDAGITFDTVKARVVELLTGL
jgi:hypothetical protein